MNPAFELTQTIKTLAINAGFDRVGIASATWGDSAPGATAPPGAAAAPFAACPCGAVLRHWLSLGYHADMAYMAANLDKRLDPTKLVQGAKSVICLAVSYASVTDVSPARPGVRTDAGDASIARFARGPDYHKLLKKRCIHLMDSIRNIAPNFAGRAFCDSAPVMERTLAAIAGVGWIGRNDCLIVPGLGSYVVLAEVISNLPLVSDQPIPPQCGPCRLCLQACPTGALTEIENVTGALIDCRKCISYLTIEHAGPIPPDLRPAMGQSIFGCDRCQQICPHNRGTGVPPVSFSADHERKQPEQTHGRDAHATTARILNWTPHDRDIATRGSTIRRASYHMLLRNAIIAAGNSGDQALIEPLQDLAGREPQLRDLSQWAIKLIAHKTTRGH